jgi:general secretion pathway protein F
MTTFQYRAYGLQGDLAQGEVEAASRNAAEDMLWVQGLTPFELNPATHVEHWWQRELFLPRGLRSADRAAFTREFSTLAAADIPLDDTLRILSEQTTSRRVGTLATSLLADVLNGATLSDALERQSFPVDYVSMVRAGEVGGALSDVVSELADLLERRMDIRSRLASALIYPAMLVALTLISLAIVLGSLVPGIAPVFAESGRTMPATLGFLVAINASWPDILLGSMLTAAMAAGGLVLLLRQPDGRLNLDRWILRLPIFGNFILQQEAARFARTLGTLLKAGVPLLQAAISARAVIGNRHVSLGLDAAIDSIREGSALHRSLRSRAIFPAVALRMISIGEEAGKLDGMLIRVATTFEQRTQRSIERFMSILTPALTLTIAGLVGSLIMTVVSAVLSMNDLVSQ